MDDVDMVQDHVTAATSPRDRLNAIYGHVASVVYFAQHQPGGPVRIGRARRLSAIRFEIVRAVIPGGQPLEHWFHRHNASRHVGGEWYEEPEMVIGDACSFGDLHALEFDATTGDLRVAQVEALRRADPFLADFERLYRNGATHVDLARASGLSAGQVRSTVDRMRALGFEMPYRRMYGARPRR